MVATEASRPRLPAWVVHGIIAGLIGAASVALFFLAVDVPRGRPLWTPHALGSALFLREYVAPDARPSPVLVTGYTLVHGTTFVALALIAAFERFVTRLLPGTALGFLLSTAALFAALEAIFAVAASMFNPELLRELTLGRVAVSNLIAAVLMAGYLRFAAPAAAAAREA